MKYRILIFMVVCTALLIVGCGNKEPLAPDSKELALNEQGAFLAKKPTEKFIPWVGSQIKGEELEPAKVWIADDGILQIRDGVMLDRIEADDDRVAGDITIIYHRTLNLNTYDGTWHSKWSLKPDAYEGTWEGVLAGKITAGIFSGYGHGEGTGELEGMKLTVEAEETGPPYLEIPESGYIIVKN